MGKAKPRNRNNKHKGSQHTGIISSKDSESESYLLSQEESVVQKITEELQSSNDEERLCGLQSLVTLSVNPASVVAILKQKVLRIVAPMLIDKNSEVRNFTAGALRNLSATGAPEICERLVKDDIMTPLLSLLQQYNDWIPESSQSVDTDTLLQVVNILWNLCESDDTALKYFGSSNLLNVLLRCLDHKTVGMDLSTAVCQCLFALSEDVTTMSALRGRESHLMSLLAIETTDNKMLLLKTLTAGIVVNLNLSTPWLAAVLPVLQEALAVDARALAAQISSQLPLDSPSSSDLPDETQTLLDNSIALLDAQTTALEILANLTASQDDEMDVEAESNSEDEEDGGWTEDGDTQLLILSPEIYEGLEKFNLVQAVLDKIKPVPTNVLEIMAHCSHSKSLAKKAVKLQCRALLCLNNLVSVVDLEHLGGPDHLCSLVSQMFKQSNSDVELLEASTAATRAILLRLASIKYNAIEITPADIEAMVTVGQSSEPRVQANVMRMVGTLGLLMAELDPNILKMVGVYLMESAEKQEALWLTAEAIDTLLDIFSEDNTDQAAADICLVARLQALAPRLKAKVRQERRTLGDHYPVVTTVMANLNPFIKYKGARVAALM